MATIEYGAETRRLFSLSRIAVESGCTFTSADSIIGTDSALGGIIHRQDERGFDSGMTTAVRYADFARSSCRSREVGGRFSSSRRRSTVASAAAELANSAYCSATFAI